MSVFPNDLKKLGFGLMRLPMKDGKIEKSSVGYKPKEQLELMLK